MSENDPFRFLNLPVNAKIEMLGRLKYQEIVDMSMLSNRILREIQSAGELIPPIKIDITLTDKGTNYVATYLDKPVKEQCMRQDWAFNRINDNPPRSLIYSRRNIGGSDLLIREEAQFYCETHRFVDFRSRGEEEQSISALIKHLHSVFKKCEVATVKYQLQGNNNTFFKGALKDVLKTRYLSFHPDKDPHIHELPRMIITHDFHNGCMNYTGGPTKDDLQCRERINVDDLPIDQLLDLNCRKVYLRRSSYQAHNIITFLKKWERSTGEEMQNIENVHISCNRRIGYLDLTELNVEMDDERQYIKRSDGKIGYISLDGLYIFEFTVNPTITNDIANANTIVVLPPVDAPPSPILVPAIVAAPEEFYTLASRDNKIFPISENALTLSAVLKKLLPMIRGSKEASSMSIPVSKTNGNILELIVRWSEEHKNEPIPTRSESLKRAISDFDMDLLNISNKDLFDLIVAVDYLDIKPLFWIACTKAALLIEGKLLEEIRQIYCIPTDEEDEAAERAEAEERRRAARKGKEKGEAGPAGKRRHIA